MTAYTEQLQTLRELFSDWHKDDLVAVLEEFNGDLETIVSRISEGYVKPFSKVSKAKIVEKKKDSKEKENVFKGNRPRYDKKFERKLRRVDKEKVEKPLETPVQVVEKVEKEDKEEKVVEKQKKSQKPFRKEKKADTVEQVLVNDPAIITVVKEKEEENTNRRSRGRYFRGRGGRFRSNRSRNDKDEKEQESQERNASPAQSTEVLVSNSPRELSVHEDEKKDEQKDIQLPLASNISLRFGSLGLDDSPSDAFTNTVGTNTPAVKPAKSSIGSQTHFDYFPFGFGPEFAAPSTQASTQTAGFPMQYPPPYFYYMQQFQDYNYQGGFKKFEENNAEYNKAYQGNQPYPMNSFLQKPAVASSGRPSTPGSYERERMGAPNPNLFPQFPMMYPNGPAINPTASSQQHNTLPQSIRSHAVWGNQKQAE
jgi:hypothetical protein